MGNGRKIHPFEFSKVGGLFIVNGSVSFPTFLLREALLSENILRQNVYGQR